MKRFTHTHTHTHCRVRWLDVEVVLVFAYVREIQEYKFTEIVQNLIHHHSAFISHNLLHLIKNILNKGSSKVWNFRDYLVVFWRTLLKAVRSKPFLMSCATSCLNSFMMTLFFVFSSLRRHWSCLINFLLQQRKPNQKGWTQDDEIELQQQKDWRLHTILKLCASRRRFRTCLRRRWLWGN